MRGNSESTVGLIVKGPKKKLNELISSLEQDKNIKLIYVRRPSRENTYLIIVETSRVKSGV